MTKKIKYEILRELSGRSKEDQLKIISALGSWLMKKQQSLIPAPIRDVTDVEYEKSKSLKEKINESNKATDKQSSSSGTES